MRAAWYESQGGAGAVGLAATAIAKHAGARGIATVRSEADVKIASGAGADEVLRTDGLGPEKIAESVLALDSEGVDHVVEVAFQANVAVDEQVLKLGGSIASYATNRANPEIPFWGSGDLQKNGALAFMHQKANHSCGRRPACLPLIRLRQPD